jgi:hypothetical protein
MQPVRVAVVVLAVLAAGCVWSVPEPTLIREPRPDAVPLRIGVYYPSELRGFTYRHHLTDTAWVLGTPSVQLLNDAFRLLFVDVVEVPRRPSNAAPATDVAAVIESRIVSAGFRYPRGGERAFPAHVIYGFTLYDPAGAAVASWSVEGAAAEPVDNPFAAVAGVKRSFEQAMREAAQKLTNGFRQAPEVRQWLAAHGVR